MALVAFKNLSFFGGLSVFELESLSPYFSRQTFKPGQVIFEQNDQAEFLYLVVKGSVIIRYKPEDGPPMKVTQIQPGGVFGWSAAMGNVAYTSGAECVEECETFKMRGKDLGKLINKYPELGEKILVRMAAIISERQQSGHPQVMSILSQGISQTKSEKKLLKEIKAVGAKELKLKEEQMKGLVEQLNAYIEHFHGGSVEYVSFDGKNLKVKLGGSCLGCPLSPATLHGWVEGTVRQFFPDIANVEAI
jgi:CRP-like cAMP-binding protein